MIKKLLPTMIGVALAGGMTAASADVQIFGHIDESIANWKSDDGTSTLKDTNLICTTCSIGFKGSEDLGNGLKAIFSLDFQYDINNRHTVSSNTYTYTTESGFKFNYTSGSTGSSAITDRDQWVGLAGGFGQVRIGTISTSYKSHGAMIDPGYRTVAQMRDWGLQSNLHSFAGEEGQGRATNTIRWDSPDFSGVKVTAHYTVDSSKLDGEDKDPWGIGGQYENGPILAYADYITNSRGGDDSAWQIGGKFSMDQFAVFANYEVDDGLISSKGPSKPVFPGTPNNSTNGADVWMLGGSFTMDSNTVYAAYAKGKDNNNPNFDAGYKSWEIVGVHGFSKSTLAYLGYVNKKGDTKGDIPQDTALALGLKKTF
jgi:predicted porin